MAIILLHWVLPRLKVLIEDEHLPHPFLFFVFPSAFVRVEILAFTLFWLVSAKTTFLEAFICLSKNLSCLFFLWTTKQSLLLTTIECLVLVLHQGLLFRFF